MAAKKNAKTVKAKDGAKPAVANKNGKKAESGSGGGSFFTWFIVLALLGVWTSVAVVYFDLVDYQGVIDKAKGIQINLSEALQGKLVAYDTDGDGDFDVEDAKIILDDRAGGAPKTAAHKDDPRPKDSHLKLREALRQQLSVIRERVEAKKLARMALAEVRQLLAKEEEEKALELGRANMSARVRERVAARLRQEEERMECEEMERAMTEKIKTGKAEEKEELDAEEEGNQTTKAEGRVKAERRLEVKARDRPKKSKSEKS